jgi:ribulose 1,5-bisphosphate carboxylase large subunit-like protein
MSEDRFTAMYLIEAAHEPERAAEVMAGEQPAGTFVRVPGELDAMLRRHDTLVAHGGSCVMVNLLSVGLAAVSRLRRHSKLLIHGRRNGWGALTRQPALGMEYRAFQELWRVAGVASLREAWDAALRGGSLEEHARSHPALRQALEQVGTL